MSDVTNDTQDRILQARELVERMERANATQLELIERAERLEAERILSGRAETNIPKKEKTREEMVLEKVNRDIEAFGRKIQ